MEFAVQMRPFLRVGFFEAGSADDAAAQFDAFFEFPPILRRKTVSRHQTAGHALQCAPDIDGIGDLLQAKAGDPETTIGKKLQ